MDVIVNEVAMLLQQILNPDAVILIGSHACGTARPDSDVDLLLLCNSSKQFQFIYKGKKFDISSLSLLNWRAGARGKLINRNLPWMSYSKVAYGRLMTAKSKSVKEEIEAEYSLPQIKVNKLAYILADLLQGRYFFAMASACSSDYIKKYYLWKVLMIILTSKAALEGYIFLTHLLIDKKYSDYVQTFLSFEDNSIDQLKLECSILIKECRSQLFGNE